MSFREFYNSILNTVISSDNDLPFPVKLDHYKKKAILTKYEQVEDRVYFINKGIVEMTIESYMSAKIIDFFFDKELVCGYTSFLTQVPTDVQITALVDCEVERIARKDLLEAYNTYLDANKFGRILVVINIFMYKIAYLIKTFGFLKYYKLSG